MKKYLSNPLTYLIIALVLGFLLRVVDINSNPPALYGDELTIAYDSYSILKTGHDQTGLFMPITFPMGAARPGGYVYGSVPFIAIFGPSALGVRGLSILSGLLLIYLVYKLSSRFFSKKVAVVAAFLAAISPWDISLSRGGFEAHFALILVLAGVILFLNATKKPIYYLISAALFGLSIHTYPTYKLSLIFFIPLLIWFVGSYKEHLKNLSYLIGSGVIILFFVILALLQTFSANSESRFLSINAFSQDDIKQAIVHKINDDRNLNSLPSAYSSIFHNKYIEYGFILSEGYLKNLAWDFLFLHGDNNPRHNMSNFGELYLIEALFIFLGIIYGFKNHKKITTFLIIWILVAPIPTTLLLEPHALRNSFMLPPLIFLSALGLVSILDLKKSNLSTLLKVGVLTILLLQFSFFVEKFYFVSPNQYSRFWAYPAKLASELAIRNKDHYDYVIISDKIDNAEYAYPTYAAVDPSLVITQNQNRAILGEYHLKKLDNVYIGSIPDSQAQQFIDSLDGSVLFIGNPSKELNLNNSQSIDGLDELKAISFETKGI